MGICKGCERPRELRLGFCFDCASAGDARSARRTTAQHLAVALRQALRGRWELAGFELRWAWERWRGTGDYAVGGYFDWAVPDWREAR